MCVRAYIEHIVSRTLCNIIHSSMEHFSVYEETNREMSALLNSSVWAPNRSVVTAD